jgi:hypothetical protein
VFEGGNSIAEANRMLKLEIAIPDRNIKNKVLFFTNPLPLLLD